LSKMTFGDRMIVSFGKNLTNSQSNYHSTALAKKVTENVQSIYAKYVTDYGSGLARPKFVKNNSRRVSTRVAYVEFKLGGPPQKKKDTVEDEEWVKNLNMYKKQSDEEIRRQMEILEDLDDTNESINKVLKAVDDHQEEYEQINKELRYWEENYGWVLEKDNEAIAAAHAELSPEKIDELRQDAKKRLQMLKQEAI